jgi:hypothetical protein
LAPGPYGEPARGQRPFVTTTTLAAPADPGSLGGGSFFKKLHRVADRHDRLGLIVWNLNAEFFFKSHDKLNRVERIGAKVVDEIGVVDHFVGLNAEMFDNDLFYALSDIAHFVRPHTGGALQPAFD